MAILTEIPEPDGRLHRYRITRARTPKGTIRVRRLDAKRDGDYRVSADERGVWHCTCKHFHFRAHAPYTHCKHVDEVRHLISEGKTTMASKSKQAPAKKPTEKPAKNGAEINQQAPAPAPAPAPEPVPAPFSEGAVERASVDDIARQLAEPFDPTEIKFKPQTIAGNRALAVPFVDARVIQDRLDDVLGIFGWQDSYECLPDGSVVCRLKVRIENEWIVKEDVGGQSEQPDEGDRRKAAFSDSLKRAAVKFGIGRYLYRQKPQWVDYDQQKRQFIRPPTLAGQPAPRQEPQAQGTSAPSKEDIPDEGMVARYAQLVATMNLDVIKCRERLKAMYGVDAFRKLTVQQGRSVINALETESQKRSQT